MSSSYTQLEGLEAKVKEGLEAKVKARLEGKKRVAMVTSVYLTTHHDKHVHMNINGQIEPPPVNKEFICKPQA